MASEPDQICSRPLFVASNCNWQIQSVYQINRQYFR